MEFVVFDLGLSQKINFRKKGVGMVNLACLKDKGMRYFTIEQGSKEHKIDYRMEGEGTPIVFVPGTAGDSKIFCGVMSHLKKSYQVISVSHIHIEDFFDMVDALHEAIQGLVSEKFHLVGTSVGGRIVQYYGEKYGSDLLSITLGNTYVSNDEIIKKNLKKAKAARVTPARILRRMLLKGIKAGIGDYDEDGTVYNYFKESLNALSKQEILIRIWWNLVELPLPTISPTLPIQVINVADDPVIPEMSKEMVATYYKQARVTTFANGGHFPYLYSPLLYADAIKNFIEQD